jgi:hypothetical protein
MSFVTGHELASAPQTDSFEIDEILKLIDPIPFLDERYKIDLIPSGNKFKACCPLPGHNDKTPSWNIDPETGYWKCWGCDRYGGLVGLVMKIEQCPKSEAVGILAEAAGYVFEEGDMAELVRKQRSLAKIYAAYLSRTGTSQLPGMISPIAFMETVRARIAVLEAKHGIASRQWSESVYQRLDDALLVEDHRTCHRLWNGLGEEAKQHGTGLQSQSG